MIQQIYDNNFGSTHEFNIKGSVSAETGGHWNLIVPNSKKWTIHLRVNVSHVNALKDVDMVTVIKDSLIFAEGCECLISECSV